MTRKIWRVASGSRPIKTLKTLQQELCGKRGIDEAAYDQFFFPSYSEHIHDPFELYDMQSAVDRVFGAVKRGEQILVYGDYDADGVSATAILSSVLSSIGARAFPFIPHRTDDGYGLSKRVLKAIEDEYDLVITVDCGISNYDEIAWLTSRGKQTIVIDHHEIPSMLPPAFAILHPRHPRGSYPWPYLSGAGMAWKFAQALLRDSRAHAHEQDQEKWLLDLAVLGTVGDSVPLIGENRSIVKFGLEVVRRTKRPGLRHLIELARLSRESISVEDMSYKLIPLINAAGRLDHAQPALDLLLAEDDAHAKRHAHQLLELNQRRQLITKTVLQEAKKLVEPAFPFVFAANERWPAGIVGLIAGRLADEMSKPAVIVGGDGTKAIGSARGFGGVHMLDAFRTAKPYLVKVGGHADAVGFSLLRENVGHLRDKLTEYFLMNGAKQESESPLAVDAVVDHSLIGWDTVELLERFEPFGEGNPRPLFVFKRLPLVDKRHVGKNHDHVKFRYLVNEQEVDGIGFNIANRVEENLSRFVDVAASIELDEFNGSSKLQLRVADIASAGHVEIMKLRN